MWVESVTGMRSRIESCRCVCSVVQRGRVGLSAACAAPPRGWLVKRSRIGVCGLVASAVWLVTAAGPMAPAASASPTPWPSSAAPEGLAFGPSGELYVSDNGNNAAENYVFRLAGGSLSVYAGAGPFGTSGYPGPATQAEMAGPFALAADTAGNLYVGEVNTGIDVAVIDPFGTISWLPYTASTTALAVNPTNNRLYWPDTVGRKAGIYTRNGSSTQLVVSDSNTIKALAFTPSGTLYYETYTNRSKGSVIKWTGSKKKTLATRLDVGTPGMVVDSSGNVYVTEGFRSTLGDGWADIKEIPGSGAAPFVLAGGQGVCAPPCTNHGDGGPASAADLQWAGALALDSQHNLYVAQSNYGVVRKIAATNGVLSPSSTIGTVLPDGPSLAARFMPVLDFDSSEKWRPINVGTFLSEQDPSTGQPWNQICINSSSCTGLQGESSLSTAPYADSYIIIHNSGGDPDTYRSPNPACLHYVGATQVYDCDAGPASSIYYHVVGPSPGGYQYIDYWFFYRYNQGFDNIGNHAGDWEGVTVAPATDGRTFDFAEFSEHGDWKSFLRDNLECDSGGTGSCGSESGTHFGQHVMTFPAAGSHANYPQANDSGTFDGGNDGAVSWGSNLDTNTLSPFPPTAAQGTNWLSGPQRWADWPGTWGDTTASGIGGSSSPCGPAASCSSDHGGHFFAPWSGVTCESGAACPARARHPQPLSCSDWLGYPVAAVACDQQAMQIALRTRGLGRRGTFTIHLVSQGRNAATAPGLAQVLGRALRPGERAMLSGAVPSDTKVLVRALDGRRLVTAAFAHVGPFHGRAVLLVRHGPDGYPSVALRQGRGQQTPSSTTRHLLPSHQRRGP
jgi:hypothetical protein